MGREMDMWVSGWMMDGWMGRLMDRAKVASAVRLAPRLVNWPLGSWQPPLPLQDPAVGGELSP